MIRKWLSRWDIDIGQLAAMLSVSLKMDVRGLQGRGTQRRRKLPPIVLSLIFYLIMGIMLAANLVDRAPLFLYSLLCLAYAQVMAVFMVLLEFGDTLLHPDDEEILGHLPIGSRTYFLGRLLNLFAFVAVVSLALSVGPALIGVFHIAGGWSFAPVFLLVALLACLASSASVVWVYTGLLRLLPYERFKDYLAYLQGAFSFAVFFAYQLIPRMGQRVMAGGQALEGVWLYLMPPAWFAGLVEAMRGNAHSREWTMALLALLSSFVLFFVAFRKISLSYSSQIAQMKGRDAKSANAKVKTGAAGKAAWVARRLKNSDVRAGYELTVAMMRSDRQVKMGMYPLLGMPLAFIALAVIEGGVVNPISGGGSAGSSFGYMTFFFVFFMIHGLMQSLLTSRDWEAAWVMRTAPVASFGNLVRGMALAVMLRCLLPFYLLLTVIYAQFSPWWDAVALSLLLCSWGLAFLSISLFLVQSLPFSRPRERGERSRQFAFLLYAAPFFVFMAVLFFLIARWRWILPVAVIFGFVFYKCFERWAVLRLNRRLI